MVEVDDMAVPEGEKCKYSSAESNTWGPVQRQSNISHRRWSSHLFQMPGTRWEAGCYAAQLAKFIGPMAGFHRHFHRPAVGNRCRADIGFAHRRDSGPLAANYRLEAAGRQKAAYTFLII